MNRKEFISELKVKLSKLPKEEIDNAVEYYEEYFDEAGTENEEKAIKEVGSPSKIASQIIANFTLKSKKDMSVLWLVILAIFAAPIAFPLAITAVVLAFAFIIVVFSLVFSFGVAGIALMVGGVFSVLLSFIVLIQHLPTAIFIAGSGLLCIGVGMLITWGTIILSKNSFIWIINLMSKFVLRGNGK